jgi:hypothetical protein
MFDIGSKRRKFGVIEELCQQCSRHWGGVEDATKAH